VRKLLILCGTVLVAAIPGSALGQIHPATPLAKLTGVYKAAKAVQVDLGSDASTLDTLTAKIETFKLELSLAADAVTTRQERDALAAYERARDASTNSLIATGAYMVFTREIIKGTAETTRIQIERYYSSGGKSGQLPSGEIPPHMQEQIDERKHKPEQAHSDAILSLNVAHALYLNKPVVRKSTPR
jgi:hypothetical protein